MNNSLKIFLVGLYLLIIPYFAFSQNTPNTATKEETIQWILSKLSQYYVPINKWLDSSHEFYLMTNFKIEESGFIHTSIILDYLHKQAWNDTTQRKFDFRKFNNYSFGNGKIKSENYNYILLVYCNGCAIRSQSSGEPDIFYDGEEIYLYIDEKMKARFINALEHLKKLSKNNREKF